MKSFTQSGGATQYIELNTASRKIIQNKGFIPDVCGGSSSGSINSAICAISLEFSEIWDESYNMALYNTDKAFDLKPELGFKQIKRGVYAVFTKNNSKKSIGIQNTTKILSEVITYSRFDYWQKNGKCEILPYAYSLDTNEPKLFNLREYNYDKSLEIIAASSAIPFLTQPICIKGIWFVDGGLDCHNPSYPILMKYLGKIKNHVSLYSRGEEAKIRKLIWEQFPIGMLNQISSYDMPMSISKKDQCLEYWVCKSENINLKQIFLEENLDSTYDTDIKDLKRIGESAIISVTRDWNKNSRPYNYNI